MPATGAARRLNRLVLVAAWAAVAVGGRAQAAPAPALTRADRAALAAQALQWGVDGGIADVKLLKDPERLIVSNANLRPPIELSVRGRRVVVWSPERIQAEADAHGDYLYFRFGVISGGPRRATVPIALVWAVSVHSTAHYLSGGGATLGFEKRAGQWHLLPVKNRWMSEARVMRLR